MEGPAGMAASVLCSSLCFGGVMRCCSVPRCAIHFPYCFPHTTHHTHTGTTTGYLAPKEKDDPTATIDMEGEAAAAKAVPSPTPA